MKRSDSQQFLFVVSTEKAAGIGDYTFIFSVLCFIKRLLSELLRAAQVASWSRGHPVLVSVYICIFYACLILHNVHR